MRIALIAALTGLITTTLYGADSLGFVPLSRSAEVGSLPETNPFLLPPGLTQQLVTSVQSSPGLPVVSDRTGATFARFGGANPAGESKFDMLTLNETGPDAGRFLFRTHELGGFCADILGGCIGGNSGVSRTDLTSGETHTILQRADLDNVDGILWTPWDTILFNEEASAQTVQGVNLSTQPDPDFPDARNGLVYEILNPLADPAEIQFVVRPALGSIAHEGIQIDGNGHLYGVDEFPIAGGEDLGAIYRFVPSVLGDLSSGQLFALKDSDPSDGAQVGRASWAPLNDLSGNPIDGVTDPRIDARAAANDVGATEYDRPEDLAVSTLANGNSVLFAATTTYHQVFSVELGDEPIVREFVNRDTIDLATGIAVGDAFETPDNLAIDADGRLYILEDNSPGDVWTAIDQDNDGVAEGVGRWASLSTLGSEPSGLYFNPLDPNEAFINVQHPTNRPPADALGDATFRILISGTQSGDFDGDHALTVADIDALLSALGTVSAQFDLNQDGRVDTSDVATWVIDLKRTWYGDANLDGEFNSGDLISSFSHGQYEDAVSQNSTWSSGDWNGDHEFTSEDLVVALADGGYLQGPRMAVNAVPEPASTVLLSISLIAAMCLPRTERRRRE